jgi:hypothetical protein
MGIESGGEQPQDFLPGDYNWTQEMGDSNEGVGALAIGGSVSADAAKAISDRICQTNPATEGAGDAQDYGVSYSVNLGAEPLDIIDYRQGAFVIEDTVENRPGYDDTGIVPPDEQ